MIEFGPDRLGHAVCAGGGVERALLRSRIPVEACPTSNVVTGSVPGYAGHPLGRLLAAGHPVSVCTDDPGVFRTTLSEELRLVHEHLRVPIAQLARMQEDAAAFAFDADPRVRERVGDLVSEFRMGVLSGVAGEPGVSGF